MEKKLHLELQYLRAKYPNAEIEVWGFVTFEVKAYLYSRQTYDSTFNLRQAYGSVFTESFNQV